MSAPWSLFGPPRASLWAFLGLLKLILEPSWAMLGSPGGPLGPKLSTFLQFFQRFWLADVGLPWSSFRICGHAWGPLRTILSLLGRFLGPPRGHLWPSWALFGDSLGVLGARLEPCWARYGLDRAPLGSSLSFFRAMLCHLEVSWELFGRHWSLTGGILGQIPRVPCGPSWGHLEACWGVSDSLYFSDAW